MPQVGGPHLSCKVSIGMLGRATDLWTRHSPGQIQVDVNTVFSRDPEKVSLWRERLGHLLCRRNTVKFASMSTASIKFSLTQKPSY